jgi:hypothetical protein
MFLSDLFSHIATLDSASINIGGDDEGLIAGIHYPKVINAINLALIELYKEFPVKEKGLVIQLYAHITNYMLHSDYADSNTTSTATWKYIQDTTFDPFVDDVIHITSVQDEDGEQLPLNTSNNTYSLYTPEYNVIQHPYPDDENAIFVAYRASPKKIPITGLDPDTYEVDLPVSLLNLFLLFVNHKLLSSVNPQESLAKLNEYINMVNNSKNLGLFLTDNTTNEKLEDSGWV